MVHVIKILHELILVYLSEVYEGNPIKKKKTLNKNPNHFMIWKHFFRCL